MAVGRKAGLRSPLQQQTWKDGDPLVAVLLPNEPKSVCDQIAEAHERIFASAYLEHVGPFPEVPALVERSAAADFHQMRDSGAIAVYRDVAHLLADSTARLPRDSADGVAEREHPAVSP